MFYKNDSMIESSESIPIQLNYIWIGPPPTQSSHIVGNLDPPIDIYGPIEMTKAAKTANEKYQINFWCLDKFVNHYKEKFVNTGVQVQSIDTYLNNMTANSRYSDMLRKLEKMKNTILTEERNRNRDRVTYKVLFSLFLLTAEGDYILDTNMRPILDSSQKYNLNLQRHDAFRIPAINLFEPIDVDDVDCWMMYSPNTKINSNSFIIKSNAAELAFNEYYKIWEDEAEPIYQQDGYTQYYHQTLGDGIISSVYQAAIDQFKLLPQPVIFRKVFWRAMESNIELGIITLANLGVEKQYYNTHWNYDSKVKPKLAKTAGVESIEQATSSEKKQTQFDQQAYQDRFFNRGQLSTSTATPETKDETMKRSQQEIKKRKR